MASQRERQREETNFRGNAAFGRRPPYFDERDRPWGNSNGAAYYCVTALVDKVVKLKNFARSKQRQLHLRTPPRGIRAKAALTVSFLDRKKHEYEDLKQKSNALKANWVSRTR